LTPEILLFALFATTSIVSALGVVFIRDPVKAAMSLIACFFCLACLYLLQRAELVAVLEVLVYAGAIMVLFVFVIMLVEHKDDAIIAHQLSQRLAVPLKVLAVATVAAAIALYIDRGASGSLDELPAGFGGVKEIGREFFCRRVPESGECAAPFLFQFEFTSLLLLVGIVGAVIISRRRQ
jgi:NADH-quinone oxidoreductase subunit J